MRDQKVSKSCCKARFALSCRKNLGTKALYARESRPVPVHEATKYQDIMDWIREKGDKGQVYFVKGIDSNMDEKWVFDDKRSWHLTSHRQELSDSGTVMSRRAELPEWHMPNPNKARKPGSLSPFVKHV